MNGRITRNVTRGAAVSITLDGRTLDAFEGETIATVIMALPSTAFRQDSRGDPRGLFCNMGTCSECFVSMRRMSGPVRRLRACLTPVSDGMVIETTGGCDG